MQFATATIPGTIKHTGIWHHLASRTSQTEGQNKQTVGKDDSFEKANDPVPL